MKNHMVLEEEERIEAQTEEMAKVLEMEPGIAVPLNLFSDCLLEASSSQRARRRWLVFLSVIFQSIVVGILILMPLMFTDVLPTKQLVSWLVAAPPPPAPPPPAVVKIRTTSITSNISNGQLIAPATIPTRIKLVREDEAPPANVAGVPGGVVGGIPGGQIGGVLGGILNSNHPPVRMPELSKRVRVSRGVSEGLILKKVVPEYPSLARTARLGGAVVLSAIISKDGTIENLTVVSGHPMLVPAAINAVKQWRYRPFLLNGMPVEIETTINVIFQLTQQ